MKQTCGAERCLNTANYWYLVHGRRIGMCFGHATQAVREAGGERTRKAHT